ncbi:PREDICTED: E3 ubiquitin-protein ligase SH3RF1 [Drosophila arizonae]|uniref:RING-type E3 ubiquitin transferase n=1 Tax=Drosophila arizonae TaxID=7263 RepID=A0ABM1PKG4_DROAR|nr:PREDICTED: E3 ubiquitin-protein ligase SH3RF1 [Drosophila arizonae]
MDEHTLNDLLECSVCLERLDTTSKVLPCQHTFCRKCLLDIVASQQKLRCPECRVLVNCRIDDLPPNVLLMRILEGMKQNAGKNDTKTEELPNKIQQQQEAQPTQQQLQQKQQQQRYQDQQQQQQPRSQPEQHQATRQKPRRFLLPHAYALFDFLSGEANDLKFKKGDLILLKKRIDNNWFVGQANGQEGTFPINYVKVVVALPMPQCIAMYDFKMGPSDEEGCLEFKKSTVIHVLRRVDHNWAEGRIGQTIGIFPIAFVELNAAAKKLLDSGTTNPLPQAQAQLMQQRALPPVPLIDPTHITNDSSTGSSNSYSSINNSSSNSSSTSSSNNCSPNHQSLPNTPQHAAAVTAAAALSVAGGGSVRYRDKGAKEKRHSLNALLQSAPLSLLQTNRHSAEILSLPHELSRLEVGSQAATATATATSTSTAVIMQPSQTSRVLKTQMHQQQMQPTLPWGYLALFAYKPRHADELELKKGCVYIVTERCVDGWFKGKNWLDITGVFPGNYLTPLRTRDQQQLMHQWKYVPPSTDMSTPAQSLDVRLSNMLPIHPPDLPPRQQHQKQESQATISSSVWSKPVEALFSRKSGGHTESRADSVGSSSGAVGLMRRLTHMKTRSKSPGASLQPKQQQLANKDSSTTAAENVVQAAPLHPVHVRSGSCPSQLQQSEQLKETTGATTAIPSNAAQIYQDNRNVSYGSQRIKSNKDRPQLLCARQSLDAATFRSMYNAASPPPPSSHTQTQLHANMILTPNHRKSQSLDAGHLLSASNSNSNSNLNANSNIITEAAIKASATTKSVCCTQESRFRCIVPYPPNSEIELELRPGDIIYVQRKQKNGWYKGTHARTHKTGLFPASFVEPDI